MEVDQSPSIKPLDIESRKNELIIEIRQNDKNPEEISRILKDDRASYAHEDVRKAILHRTKLLQDNPRQMKKFINQFRLLVYIANERGMFKEQKINQQDIGLTLDRLAIWVAWSLRWPDVVKLFFKEAQSGDLRAFLSTLPGFIEDDGQWTNGEIMHDNAHPINKIKEIREKELNSKFHWSHFPWEWWLNEIKFREAIKKLECIWCKPQKNQIDWLDALLTMTGVNYDQKP